MVVGSTVNGIVTVVWPGANVRVPELGLNDDAAPSHAAQYNSAEGPSDVVKSTWTVFDVRALSVAFTASDG